MGNALAVLIAERDAHVREALGQALERRGLGSACALDPHNARQWLQRRPFSLLVLDIATCGPEARDLLAFANEHAPDCRVIVLSEQADAEAIADAISLGAYEFFPKPLEIGEVAAAAVRACSQSRPPLELSIRAARAMQMAPRLQQTSLETIRALIHAVEAKDPYTRRHSEQVSHYAQGLARQAELPAAAIESTRLAGLLHDIGKISVPDDVLTKSGPLSDEEFHHIRRHPVVGAEILSQVSVFAAEVDLVRSHHENWDGSGYPDGLAGEQIPLGARFLNLADAMDAMLMARTYKDAYPLEQMLSELERCAGSQFDPPLAAMAVRWCQANPDQIILPDSVAVA